MRAVLILVGVAVVLLLVGIFTGFINLSGEGGQLPKVAVEGGQLPSVDADVGSIDVGTTNETIEVPKIETEKETIKVPDIDVKSANEK